VLREAGYTVFEAGNGVQALQLLRQRGGSVPDLLVTDVIMPEMDGRRLAEEVRQLYPKIKIIFISGYTEDVIGTEGVLNPDVVLMQKPFTPATLAKKVREVLDR
jgi:CheY-like chemotaxis protein